MAIPTVIATVGAANANSYGTLAEADVYHDSVLHTDVPWPTNIAASITIGSGTNGVVTITVVEPGSDGNSYTVEVVAGSGLNIPLSAALVGTALTVTLGTDGAGVLDATKNTATLVAAVIDAISEFTAVASGSGVTVIPVTASTSFVGGSSIEATKNPALIMATQLMESIIEWSGFPASLTQSLAWPRTGMWEKEGLVYVSDSAIPDRVKWAQFELARLLINGDRTAEFDVDTNGIVHLRAGPVTIKFKDGVNPGPPVIPTIVWNLLNSSWYYSSLLGINIDLERA